MIPTDESIGRPVRVISLSFPQGHSREEIAALVDREAAAGADLIALPETWLGQEGHEPEPLDGPTITVMSALARRHRTYIVCPIDRTDGLRRLNSAVLLDREGEVAGVYDKVYPFWSEFDVQPPISVAGEVPVFATDFGRVGMAICFDVNFPSVWQRLADGGAELVIWSSAYSAGSTLRAHALMYHYVIVTSTLARDCIVCDITGEEVHYSVSEDLNIARLTLDLDRGIYHYDFNLPKRDRLLAERGDDVEQERVLPRESWFVLRARRPGVSARALAAQYGLEELGPYIARSQREINARRALHR